MKTKLTIAPEQCGKLMANLQESSSHFQRTGGVHNAALCTTDGKREVHDIIADNADGRVQRHLRRNLQSSWGMV